MIESKIPTTSGFLFEWLDRKLWGMEHHGRTGTNPIPRDVIGFIRLMGLPEMRSVEGYDFTLQGVYGIWNGRPATVGRTGESSGSVTQREIGPDGFLYSKAVATRTPRGSRTPDDSLDTGYIRAMDTIIRQRPDEFLDAKFPHDTSKRLHRRFMLAICGELTGVRLEAEILR